MYKETHISYASNLEKFSRVNFCNTKNFIMILVHNSLKKYSNSN
jgi:hypothetical protein